MYTANSSGLICPLRMRKRTGISRFNSPRLSRSGQPLRQQSAASHHGCVQAILTRIHLQCSTWTLMRHLSASFLTLHFLSDAGRRLACHQRALQSAYPRVQHPQPVAQPRSPSSLWVSISHSAIRLLPSVTSSECPQTRGGRRCHQTR